MLINLVPANVFLVFSPLRLLLYLVRC